MHMEPTPFHAGEIEAQRRAGTEESAAATGRFVRNRMPDQHRAFFAALPFLVVASGDDIGRPWVTILEGPEGFIASPDPCTLTVAATLGREDPLARALEFGAAIGTIGIELATRRRNRLNGIIRRVGNGFSIDVRQSFGNCPQYIREREWHRVELAGTPAARVSDRLDDDQMTRIKTADTFFVGSGYRTGEDGQSDGYDASHRGGEPGFVHIAEDGTLQIPDYAGNNFFNTIGNLVRDARIGLLFVDFQTGGLLQITGHARIDWEPKHSHDPNARRVIDVTVNEVVDRAGTLGLRWTDEVAGRRRLKVADKVAESDQITSIYLAATGGEKLDPFRAGQYLPIELTVPGQPGRIKRSYSLSGSPLAGTYRISVKREEHGIASRVLHDHVKPGDSIDAHRPSGEFLVPCGGCPLVLVSAGVGITPLLAMLHSVVVKNPKRLVWFVHVTRDSRSYAFAAEIDALVAAHSNVHAKVFHSAADADDISAGAYGVSARMTGADILALDAGSDAHYMLCGPVRFLADIRLGLEAGKVPTNRIHFEMFGPNG